MKSCLLLGILLVLPIEAPSAAEPDAPVVATPTLATEIKRGMDAESACSETIDPPGYARCIFAIEARNQQMMMSNKPFDTGLFFKAWYALDSLANSSSPTDTDVAKQLAEGARRQAASMFAIYRADQRKVGVADNQVIEISGTRPTNVESRFAFWDSQPP